MIGGSSSTQSATRTPLISSSSAHQSALMEDLISQAARACHREALSQFYMSGRDGSSLGAHLSQIFVQILSEQHLRVRHDLGRRLFRACPLLLFQHARSALTS